MKAIYRRGACPALTAPMRTGDGLLVRLNTVAEGFSPSQLVQLCGSALRHGNGVIEVTARGSLQIRGLTEDTAPLLAMEVDALAMPVRTGVPVEIGPLSGLDPDEVADPRPLAAMIRDAVASAGLATRLGPKVSVVVDGGGRLGMEGVSADVRLTAEAAGTSPSPCVLWRLALAGDEATAATLAEFSQEETASAVLALLHAIAELGIDARGRDLTAAAIGKVAPPIAARRSGVADVRAAARIREVVSSNSLLGPIPLTDSRHAIAIALPFGFTDAAMLARLADAAETLGVSEIRLSPGRRLIFVARTATACLKLRSAAAELGFITEPRDARLAIAACPGTPACASGHIAARAIAQAIAASHGDALDGSLAIHISGCAKGCAHPSEANLSLVGAENGARLVVGGTAASQPVAYASQAEPRARMGAALALVGASRATGESSADCLARLGAERLAAAFQQG